MDPPEHADFLRFSAERGWGWGISGPYTVARRLWGWTGVLRIGAIQLVTLLPAIAGSAVAIQLNAPAMLWWVFPAAVAHVLAPRSIIGLVPVVIAMLVAFGLGFSERAHGIGILITMLTVLTRMWGDWWVLALIRVRLVDRPVDYEALRDDGSLIFPREGPPTAALDAADG